MSTGQRHPLAESYFFDSGIEEFDEVHSFRIHKDLIAIYAGSDDEPILQVWNWKTAELLLVRHARYPRTLPPILTPSLPADRG